MIQSHGPTLFFSIARCEVIGALVVMLATVVVAVSPQRIQSRIIAPQALFQGHRYAVQTIAFAPDGRTVASCAGLRDQASELDIWDVDTGLERAALRGHRELIESVVFSPDGKTLATSGSDGTVRLRDADTLKELTAMRGHTQEALFLAFSKDGKTLVSAGRDQTVHFWDPSTGQKQAGFTQRRGNWILSLAFANDSPVILIAQGATPNMVLWDLRHAKELATFNKPSSGYGDFACYIVSLALSPNGGSLAAGSTDGSVWLWDMPTGRVSRVWQGHPSMVTAVAFSPRGTCLATGSADGIVKLWETGSAEEIALLHGHTASVTALAFSPDGTKVVSGSNDRKVAVWKLP